MLSSSTYDSRKSVYNNVLTRILGTMEVSTHLDVMFGKLLGQRSARISSGIHGIINGHLPVLVVQPGVDVLPALLQDLLSEYD